MKKKRGYLQEGDLPKLAAPAQGALASAGILRLEQLSKFSEAEIKCLHGIGPNALSQLRRALHAKGLTFAGEGNGNKISKEPQMNKNLIAKASININAPREKVWNALVSPEAIQQYMFGTTVVSEWRAGSPIVWKGEWQGKSYEDKGTILQIEPKQKIQYNHFSPLSGLPDKSENYHTITIELSVKRNQTHVLLTQDNNASEEERSHSEKNWETVLAGLKKVVEQ